MQSDRCAREILAILERGTMRSRRLMRNPLGHNSSYELLNDPFKAVLMTSSTSTHSSHRPVKLRRWSIPALIGISLFWLIWCLCLFYNSSTARPVLLPNKLIASTNELAPAFTAVTPRATSVSWSDSQAPMLFDELITDQRNSFVSVSYRAHTQSNHAIEINQVVSDALWPVFAAGQMLRANPGTRDRIGDAPFSALSMPYRSTAANQQRAVCMKDGRDGCHIAYVWAQYGQYFVRLRIAGEDAPVSGELINALFEQIDRHIIQT